MKATVQILLLCVLGFSAHAQTTVQESQARAIAKYPALGVSGSELNKRFVEAYTKGQKETPAFFKNANWPFLLAEKLAGETWRTDMAAFAKSVAAIVARSEIPTSAQINGMRDSMMLHSKERQEKWVLLTTSFGKEVHGELLKAFDGKVEWRGKVTEATLDQDKKASSIRIAFPEADKLPAKFFLDDVFLRIPFDTLPPDKLPAVGSTFAFRATFKTATKEDPFDRVHVLYNVGSSNSGKDKIGVSLTDISPAEK